MVNFKASGHAGEHKRALHYYRQALGNQKLSRSAQTSGRADKGLTSPRGLVCNEAELKLRQARCHVAINEKRQAISLLETVPSRSRAHIQCSDCAW